MAATQAILPPRCDEGSGHGERHGHVCQKENLSWTGDSHPPVTTARPGQVMWTERPLITYKKRAADEDLEAYVDSLHQVFCQLDETAQAKLLDMYGPEEELGRQGVQWKLFRWLFQS